MLFKKCMYAKEIVMWRKIKVNWPAALMTDSAGDQDPFWMYYRRVNPWVVPKSFYNRAEKIAEEPNIFRDGHMRWDVDRESFQEHIRGCRNLRIGGGRQRLRLLRQNRCGAYCREQPEVFQTCCIVWPWKCLLIWSLFYLPDMDDVRLELIKWQQHKERINQFFMIQAGIYYLAARHEGILYRRWRQELSIPLKNRDMNLSQWRIWHSKRVVFPTEKNVIYNKNWWNKKNYRNSPWNLLSV